MENDKIRVLPDGVANQIAAGEVVGRPASVVKELMENSVDAGSRTITVNYKDGGRSLIQVVDDGCGMSETDARLAFERHATSKIRRAEDLYQLASFGFRGEALPSVASVAEVELRTRTADREIGTQVVIHGGRFVSQEPVQTAVGTQFLVKNLFYNTPARRRFLKEANVEGRHIRSEFLRVALCNPEVAFSLYDNDVLIATLPASNLRQRIVSAIGGKDIAKNLLEVGADTSIVRIEGFVGRPSAAKKTNREQYLFVNGRYFSSPYFRKAILQAYEKLIAPDTQPSYFLYLTIDPQRIDVNVHPQKTEIKFDDEQAVWQIFNAAVRESLGRLGVVPMMDFEMDSSIDIPGGCRFQDSRSGDQSGLQSVPGGEDGGAACFSGVRQPGPETLGEPLSGAGRRCDGTGFSGTAFQRIRQRRTGIYRRERFGNGAADAGVGCGTPFFGSIAVREALLRRPVARRIGGRRSAQGVRAGAFRTLPGATGQQCFGDPAIAFPRTSRADP